MILSAGEPEPIVLLRAPPTSFSDALYICLRLPSLLPASHTEA